MLPLVPVMSFDLIVLNFLIAPLSFVFELRIWTRTWLLVTGLLKVTFTVKTLPAMTVFLSDRLAFRPATGTAPPPPPPGVTGGGAAPLWVMRARVALPKQVTQR